MICDAQQKLIWFRICIFLKDIDNSLRGEYNIDIFNAYKIRNQKEDAYFNDKYITNLTKNLLFWIYNNAKSFHFVIYCQ